MSRSKSTYFLLIMTKKSISDILLVHSKTNMEKIYKQTDCAWQWITEWELKRLGQAPGSTILRSLVKTSTALDRCENTPSCHQSPGLYFVPVATEQRKCCVWLALLPYKGETSPFQGANLQEQLVYFLTSSTASESLVSSTAPADFSRNVVWVKRDGSVVLYREARS